MKNKIFKKGEVYELIYPRPEFFLRCYNRIEIKIVINNLYVWCASLVTNKNLFRVNITRFTTLYKKVPKLKAELIRHSYEQKKEKI